MASTFSPNLALELIGTGDQAGQWGNTTNTNLGTLIEQSISGYVTQAVATGTDTTITIPNGATGVARNMYIELTGTGGASTNLIVPANKKLYFIFNNTASGQVTVKVSGQTGVSVPNKAKMILVSNGTDIVDATNYIGSAVIGNLTATSGTITTLASSSAVITQLNSTSGTISTLASTSAAITTLSGTTLTYASASITNLTAGSLVLSNLSIASANITTLTSSSATISTTLALSGGTANGVLYLNASKVATSGSALTFDGTNLTATGTSTFGGSTEKVIVNRLSDFTAYGLITFNGAFGSATGAGIYGRGSGGDSGSLYYNVPTGAAQRFQVNGDTKLTLDSSGNLGLGVTPSAWTSFRAMQIGNGYGVMATTSGTPAFYMLSNAFYDGAYKYIGTGYASEYYQYEGTHVWRTAASGTAGNAITFTQAMTLDASGNLGVGNTSPQAKLHVGDSTEAPGFGVTSKMIYVNGTTQPEFLARETGSDVVVSMYASTTVGAVRTATNHPLTFLTDNTERARITAGGDFLSGTTDAGQLSGNGNKLLPGGAVWVVNAGNTDGFSYYNTAAAAYRFYVGANGTISATNTTISAISDQRFKENIQDLDVGLDAILALKPRKFDWKEGKGKDKKDDRGFIAQEVEQVFPDLIDEWKDPAPEGEEPYKSVRQDLIPVLVKAIQEQQAMINDLKAEVAALKGA